MSGEIFENDYCWTGRYFRDLKTIFKRSNLAKSQFDPTLHDNHKNKTSCRRRTSTAKKFHRTANTRAFQARSVLFNDCACNAWWFKVTKQAAIIKVTVQLKRRHCAHSNCCGYCWNVETTTIIIVRLLSLTYLTIFQLFARLHSNRSRDDFLRQSDARWSAPYGVDSSCCCRCGTSASAAYTSGHFPVEDAGLALRFCSWVAGLLNIYAQRPSVTQTRNCPCLHARSFGEAFLFKQGFPVRTCTRENFPRTHDANGITPLETGTLRRAACKAKRRSA